MPDPTQRATVLRVRDLTPSVRELVLAPQQWKVSFAPGQWVSLKLPIGERPPLTRAYTMSEPESLAGELALVFDRVPHGRGSQYLFTLKTGEGLELAGPYGTFVPPEPLTKDLLLIGRYTGLVPFHCMIRALLARPLARKITVIAIAPSATEQLYHEEFTALAAAQETFRYVSLVERDEAGSVVNREQVIEALATLGDDGPNVVPMICGIKSFARPLRDYFTARGFPRREVRVETYD
jgi:NAD(P)H-flavin reductase